MKDDDKTNFLNNIKTIYSNQKEYKPFIYYFIKNWSTSNFLDFEVLEQENILERTDNVCEVFHTNLNHLIENIILKFLVL